MGRVRKSSYTNREFYNGKHRFEHWFRDNTLYFITSRTRDRSAAFASDAAKAIFWDRFDHYAEEFAFRPIVATLLDNHYHHIGYVKDGENLWRFIQRLRLGGEAGERHAAGAPATVLALRGKSGLF